MPRTNLALFIVFLAAPALAGTPDQSNEGPQARAIAVGVRSGSSLSAAQTIRVGYYGGMDRVEMYVSATGTLTSPMVLEVRPVVDDVISDPLLASSSVTPSPTGPQWVAFDFSAHPIDVLQGQRIALVVRSDQDLLAGQYVAQGTHDLYPRGAAFTRASGGPWNPANDVDLMFRTFVDVPNDSCCNPDFDRNTEITDGDIEAFFACLGGDCCGTCPSNADFNCDGDVGTDVDIQSFFAVLAGSSC